MKPLFRTSLVLILLCIGSHGFTQQKVSIIPQPVSLLLLEGDFVINNETVIHLEGDKKELKPAAAFFQSYINGISGYHLLLKKRTSNAITLKLINNPLIGTEGYTLTVGKDGILIAANARAGIIYGMQSLFQTLPQVQTNRELKVPAMEITDYPRFKWRGMHLDVGRHFFSADMVKAYIDLIAAYKINTFHWHLVDDQGWRIEIKKYPALTAVGAWRVDQTDRPWDIRPQAIPGQEATYGGYYTQEQIKEIIAYAKIRNVSIVPEIEMPGHVASAIAAYPNLSCSQKTQLPLTGGNYSGASSNYCAGNEEVFTFLEEVLNEVVALFPSKYIHIGGDEVDKTSWKGCPRCQARMKTLGLKNENELQSYFITRMEKFLISKQKRMIGWDEILEGGLAPEATVMSWRGEAGGIEAAKMNHEVVMTPDYPLYFDHYQAGPEGEPLAFGGFNTLKKVYHYEPIPKELNAEQAKYVLGAQANIWTEHITTKEHLEYMLLPRMLALAEVVWSPVQAKSWDAFSERLKYHFKGFEQKGYRFSPGNYTVAIKPAVINGKLTAALLSDAVNGEIFYTLNGDVPTIGSLKYTGPVVIDSTAILKAIFAVNGAVMGLVPSKQSFVFHQATTKNVSYVNPVSPNYLADGPNSLTDGIRGTAAVNKYWHGFNGQDLIATIDLGKQMDIGSISLGCLQNYKDWIMMPRWVKFESAEDGINFKELKTINSPVSPEDKMTLIHDFKASFNQRKARFIRVTAKVLEALPKGHSGEGKPAWLFADEIVVTK
ncbi:glycoside hydrolase family 20 protein [Pedobacter steynii]|uniref:beta-N-acetylhexosaminidase n=1 Tax=Pedobacter steynii TaxID=430522 RepID=A0A1D7QE98_9SPHI|nr:glycoside hydrolase family 20 protein [Pedobacter steynii]AOM76934.1 beta-N-acetylhexosaminidase [Pedobacter steynii]